LTEPIGLNVASLSCSNCRAYAVLLFPSVFLRVLFFAVQKTEFFSPFLKILVKKSLKFIYKLRQWTKRRITKIKFKNYTL